MECNCKRKFMDAEDYRDHLPCGGDPVENATIKSIVAWLRTDDSYATFSIEGQWVANAIERGDWKRWAEAERMNKDVIDLGLVSDEDISDHGRTLSSIYKK